MNVVYVFNDSHTNSCSLTRSRSNQQCFTLKYVRRVIFALFQTKQRSWLEPSQWLWQSQCSVAEVWQFQVFIFLSKNLYLSFFKFAESSAIPIFHGYYLSALQEGCHSKTNESTIRPSGVAQFRSCIAKHLDLQETQREYAQLNDFSRIQFFDKYCPQINSSLECFGPMMEDLRRCRDPEDMKLYEVVAETLPKAVSWICLNHGEVFASECSLSCWNYRLKMQHPILSRIEGSSNPNVLGQVGIQSRSQMWPWNVQRI